MSETLRPVERAMTQGMIGSPAWGPGDGAAQNPPSGCDDSLQVALPSCARPGPDQSPRMANAGCASSRAAPAPRLPLARPKQVPDRYRSPAQASVSAEGEGGEPDQNDGDRRENPSRPALFPLSCHDAPCRPTLCRARKAKPKRPPHLVRALPEALRKGRSGVDFGASFRHKPAS